MGNTPQRLGSLFLRLPGSGFRKMPVGVGAEIPETAGLAEGGAGTAGVAAVEQQIVVGVQQVFFRDDPGKHPAYFVRGG